MGRVVAEGRATDDLKQVQCVGHHVGGVGAGGAVHHGAGHFRGRAWQAGCAAAAHDAGQAAHALWCGGGQTLRNHAAHADANQMRLGHAQRVEQAQRVVGHVLQRVGLGHIEPQLVLDHLPRHAGCAQHVKVRRQADVTVVIPHHAVARLKQGLNERIGPGHQLHAQPHGQQHGTCGGHLAGWVVNQHLETQTV